VLLEYVKTQKHKEMEVGKEKASLLASIFKLEGERDLDKALLESQRGWIKTLQKQVDSQQKLLNDQSLSLASHRDEGSRVGDRVTTLVRTFPSASAHQKKPDSNLKMVLDKWWIEQEAINALVTMLESLQGTSQIIGTLTSKNDAF